MDDIFDKFIVVDEKSFTDLKIENAASDKRGWPTICSIFRDLSPFAALEIKTEDNCSIRITHIGNITKSEVPLAQIICWEWNEKGEQVIEESTILNTGDYLILSFNYLSSIVIKILKQREDIDGSPCPPLNSPDDDFTLQIGNEKITVSAAWFVYVSPVVRRMLSVDMREKQQRLITLDELGVNMELFMEFMEAISLNGLKKPILPNPKNVLILLKLADFFQMDWLKSRCETHLINCVEIPLIDRFLLIEKYRLGKFKNYFLHLMNVDNFRAFFKANCAQFLSGNAPVSTELLNDMIFRLCG